MNSARSATDVDNRSRKLNQWLPASTRGQRHVATHVVKLVLRGDGTVAELLEAVREGFKVVKRHISVENLIETRQRFNFQLERPVTVRE